MGNREKLDETGKRILEASRTELYLSMRFLGPALHSLGFVMDLSTASVGTDAAAIRFNPNYLFRLYVEQPRMLNRTYLHMLLHCVLRHMFTAREKEDRELWDLACDIAVESIIDSMEYSAVAQLTPEHRQRVYDTLGQEIRVLTAERIYRYYAERKRNYLEELQLRAMFTMCDHSFWGRMEKEEDRGDGSDGENENPGDSGDQSGPDKRQENEDHEESGNGRNENNSGDPEKRRDTEADKDCGEKSEDQDPDSSVKRKPSDGAGEGENPARGEKPDLKGKDRDGKDQSGTDRSRTDRNRDPGTDRNRDPGTDRDKDPGADGRKDRREEEKDRRPKQRKLRRLKPFIDDRELKEHWKETSKRMEAEILASGKEASDERGSLDRILAISNRERTDYREFLRKFAILREVTTIDPDSFDYGFYNYGLEFYGNMPLIEENEYCEINKIRTLVIAIDTSASCQEVLVQRFLNETAAVLRSIGQFFHSSEVHIIECDEHVRQEVVVHSAKELERYADAFHVKGGFGTDFRPVFSYVEEKRKSGGIRDLEGLMYFTDGMGIYPEKPTDYDTAFVFFNDEELDDSRVPDWALKLYIDNKRVVTGHTVTSSRLEAMHVK